MEPILLLRNKNELKGTNYFEFLPGAYQGEYWNDHSVFLVEEVFGYIEPVIQRNAPEFDYYGSVNISKASWTRIVGKLEQLCRKLMEADGINDVDGAIGFFFTVTREEFSSNFRSNVDSLVELCNELIDWLKQQLETHEYVSLLGM